MALSQDEQRMLAEIERRLAADDPGLASCLTTFRRPGPATVLRSPRARIIGSLFTVLLVAMVSLMVYAVIPFRTHMLRHSPPPTAGATANTAISAVTSGQPNRTQQSSAGAKSTASQTGSTASQSTGSQSTGSQAAASASATGHSTASTASSATGKTQQAKGKPTNAAMLPEANP
jgi:cytoskeletal protein RodZ